LVTRLSAIQATGLLTFTLTGLSPAEHTSLSWTHNPVRNLLLGAPRDKKILLNTPNFKGKKTDFSKQNKNRKIIGDKGEPFYLSMKKTN